MTITLTKMIIILFQMYFFSIKNLMSDRCSVQKKFINLFYEYRKFVIPEIIDNWEDLDAKQKKMYYWC